MNHLPAPQCMLGSKKGETNLLDCGGCRLPADDSKPYRLVKVTGPCRRCLFHQRGVDQHFTSSVNSTVLFIQYDAPSWALFSEF